jgi:Lon protease-like protein
MAMPSGGKAWELPAWLPVFAIPGVILLPGGQVPLVVFEPRYLALVDDALGAGRLFALVQPSEGSAGPIDGLHAVGTLARITAFGEMGDGRYLITAAGIHRFRLTAEQAPRSGYRVVAADYAPFSGDRDDRPVTLKDRDRLLALIRAHLGSLDLNADLDALERLSHGELADRMAMACPFPAEEKQVLLEAPTHAERCRLMIAMIQRSLLAAGGGTTMH